MLSLPLIPPQPQILQTHFRPRSDSPPPPTAQNGQQQQQHHHRQHQQQRRNDSETKAHNARSPLALLAADEAAIAQRKAAIRNFGAYWIRPPGVSKTLQATNEEAAERAEQEELERQEQGLRDMQAQQQLEEARARAAETATEDAEDGEVERDLDADIPEADADASALEASEAEDVTFNEDSMVEGSRMIEQEEAELTGAARDQEELGVEPEQEHNLDDSIPEAGSYQHTDTEVEDSDSDSELQDSFAARPPQSAARPAQGALHDRLRNQVGGDALTRSPGSLNLSSSILESSFVGSSPVMQRGRGGRRARRS